MRNQIIQGSVLDAATWAEIPDQHCQTCITSPPYWGLRDYGVEGQLGLEKTPEEFVARMVEVFRHVRRVLRDDGTVWLNLGDSYASGKGTCYNPGGGSTSLGQHRKAEGAHPIDRGNKSTLALSGLKPKDLCGIPWRVALALQADGWYLRQDIIWHKPNPMPESVRDRCTKSHEYLFLLTKKPRYYCDMEAIKEPSQANEASRVRSKYGRYDAGTGDAKRDSRTGKPDYLQAKGNDYGGGTRNKRSVWTVATAPYKEAHFATFPPKLIEPCVLAGTSEKGCCPECGKPWVRVVERTVTFQSGSGKSGNPIAGKNGSECQGGGDTGDIRKGPCVSSVITSWGAQCKCGPDGEHSPIPIPCIVFDPFMGSGTTGMVARQNGCDYLGIELNPEYIDLIEKRIGVVEMPMFR